LEEYLKLKNEMVRDKVDEIFRTQPKNYRKAMEEIGFTYVEEEDEEGFEEKKARPKNKAQRDLVAYLEGERKLSEGKKDNDLPSLIGTAFYPVTIKRYFIMDVPGIETKAGLFKARMTGREERI
jgi:hypothetical protein